MGSGYDWKVGDLVWAKMKGFSAWPGKIAHPRSNMKKPKTNKTLHCVWFFGSDNFGWIDDSALEHYADKRDKNAAACKTVGFKQAVVACDDYVARKEAGEDVEAKFMQDYMNDEEEPDDEFAFADEMDSDGSVTSETETTTRKRQGRTRSKDDTGTGTEGKKKRGRPSSISSRASTRTSRSSRSAPKKKKTVEENGDSKPKSPPKSARKERKTASLRPNASPLSDMNTAATTNLPRRSAASNLLNRPAVSVKPEAEPLNIDNVSEALKNKQIKPSDLKLGFLGLGNMGSGMVKNLIHSGHKVTVWNRTPDKCRDFVTAGCSHGTTPSDVVAASDIIFSCVSDGDTAREMVFGNCGVYQEMSAHKAYVEMTSIDVEASKDIADGIGSKGGRYLEAQIQGSKSDSEEGTLIILAAGERSLYDECISAFAAMSIESFYLGEIGSAVKMNLVLQLIQGVAVTALSEGLALADRANLKANDVMEILAKTAFSNKLIKQKGATIIDANFAVQHPLQYMQKDLNMALSLGNLIEQPLPITASANEVFKHAKRLGYSEHDVSAVYIRARF